MTPLTWPCPVAGGVIANEYALSFDRGRPIRIQIVPALFDEGNRMRRLTVEVMRRLDGAGIDSFLPDLPGTNESLLLLEYQSCEDWRDAMTSAAACFDATHAMGIRGGCMFTPPGLQSWHYAPVKGAALLRQILRARILASREAGREETREQLVETGEREGLDLAGYRLGADMIRELAVLEPASLPTTSQIAQDMIGGSGLWLRAEPGESMQQADALAAVIAMALVR